MPDSEVICGRHPVLEALKSGRPCRRLHLLKGGRGPAIDEIFTHARQAGIPFQLEERARLDQLAGPHHQGVVAQLAARAYADYNELLASADPSRAFFVFLDGVQDPHNLGAIVRSAHAVGADAVILPARGAAGITATAVKAAAGAAEYLPICRVTNLRRALSQASTQGLWITGLDAAGQHTFSQIDYRGPCALVVGGEDKGLRPGVRKLCDFTARIPMGATQVGSFNASVAAGLALYEVFRQRDAAP
ncbi:MAG: 23S rRNA (guanosine(2251)-2'-O)-methyltransferase RlmB [Candidatus Latescibacteria bacterium]|nr:23S rRNA (guanosine(2251)-2'-O)-methyltransferase RlmB [Candidatus Latescibacterota bacterium]